MDNSPIKICLVDDDIDIVTTFLCDLMAGEFYVFAFTSAADALEAFENGMRVDVTITDLRMPKVNGLDFVRRLREMHIETQIIMISGDLDSTSMKNGLKSRVWGFLEKPFTVNQLRSAITQAANG